MFLKVVFNKHWSVVWQLSAFIWMPEKESRQAVWFVSLQHLKSFSCIRLSKYSATVQLVFTVACPLWKQLSLDGLDLILSRATSSILLLCKQGGAALSTNGLWSRPLGNFLMFSINQSKLGRHTFTSSCCSLSCLEWEKVFHRLF